MNNSGGSLLFQASINCILTKKKKKVIAGLKQHENE